MDTTIKGKFFIGEYDRVMSVTNRDQSLDSMLAHLYQKGVILSVAISVNATSEKLPLCNAQTQYRDSKCGMILDADGGCPGANYHKKDEDAEN